MKVLIAEDDDIHATTLRVMFLQMDYERIEIVTNSIDLFACLPTLQPDLLVLDVHIEGDLDGIQVAERVQETHPFVPVIFITSLQQKEVYARAKATKPYAFLNKPFDEKVLMHTIELAFQQYEKNQEIQAKLLQHIYMPDSLMIKVEGVLKKVRFEDIGFIEAQDKYVYIITQKQKYLMRFTMHELLEKLPSAMFEQVSRSYIINLSHISEVHTEKNELTIFEQTIPFSRRNKQELLNRLQGMY